MSSIQNDVKVFAGSIARSVAVIVLSSQLSHGIKKLYGEAKKRWGKKNKDENKQ